MNYQNQNKLSAPLKPVNKKQKDATVTEVSEWEIIEFTKEEEEVNVLLNDKFKVKSFDSKVLEDLVKEKDHLHTMLDSSERKCVEAEAAMKLKESELNLTIAKLENNIFSLQESLILQDDMYKRLQEHNIKLQNELASAKNSRDDAVKQKETAVKQVEILRCELQKLSSESAHNAAECTLSKSKLITSEKTCATQRGHISVLQYKLNAANQKLKELKSGSKWYLSPKGF